MPLNTDAWKPYRKLAGSFRREQYGIFLMQAGVRVKHLVTLSSITNHDKMQKVLEFHAKRHFGTEWTLRPGHAHILNGFPEAFETSGNRVIMVDLV